MQYPWSCWEASLEAVADQVQLVLEQFGKLTHAVRDTSTADDLRQAMIAFNRSCGVAMSSYYHGPPPGAEDYTSQVAISSEGFPEAWVKRYRKELHEFDPIPKRALRATQVIFWSEAGQLYNLSGPEKRFLEEFYAAVPGDGMAVPVFGPYGRGGCVLLGFGDSPRPHRDVVTLLSAACQLGHERYCRLLHRDYPEGLSLSPREAEILLWVARGKSNAVIAQILAISANTVDTHLRRVFGKLGVQDRVTATLRGAALGLL